MIGDRLQPVSMQYASGRPGRIFYLRLDHDEDLLSILKEFIKEHQILSGMIHLIGAISEGDIVTGPRETVLPPEPVWMGLHGAHELIGTAMIRTGSDGPHLHLHASAGRGEEVLTGCIRKGARVYIVIEAVIIEFEEFTIGVTQDTRSGQTLPVINPSSP